MSVHTPELLWRRSVGERKPTGAFAYPNLRWTTASACRDLPLQMSILKPKQTQDTLSGARYSTGEGTTEIHTFFSPLLHMRCAVWFPMKKQADDRTVEIVVATVTSVLSVSAPPLPPTPSRRRR